MARGQKRRVSLYPDWHQAPSRITDGLLNSSILPVFSSTMRLTIDLTRSVRPQKGTCSASKYRPLFLLFVSSVFRISSYDLTRTQSPGLRPSVELGVACPEGMLP